MTVYYPGEIWGAVDGELSPQLYQRWGHALGMQTAPGAKVVVGGDLRASTPEFRDALSEGLRRAGAQVVDVGHVTTPMLAYARRRLQAAAYAMVTASHHPAEYNGLRWMIGDSSPSADDAARLARAARRSPSRSTRSPGVRRSLDVSFDYVAWLQETWVESMGAHRRVVLDPLHGTCAAWARRCLQAVFPAAVFSAIHDAPDASLGGLAPDCAKHDRLRELAVAVEHEGADLGIAFDGDGDRLAVVDGEGMILTADELACVLLHSFGDALSGRRLVYDWGLSNQVADAARRLGAEPLAERTCMAAIRTRMRSADAAFAAHAAGHYFFRPLDAGDDALFTACWLLDWLNHCGQSLTELRAACPAAYMTPELCVELAPASHAAVLKRIAKAWPRKAQTALGGVRVELPQGWALAWNTAGDPCLHFRFEARDWKALGELVWRYCETLDEVGDQLWMRYTAALGGNDRHDP